eukprot:7370876-Prymnesium_polylepis.1
MPLHDTFTVRTPSSVFAPRGEPYLLSRALLNALDAAEQIGPASFAAAQRVQVGASARSQYKVIRAPQFVETLRRMHERRVRSASGAAAALSDALLEQVLPHVQGAGGRELTLQDLAYQGFMLLNDGHFPFVHWDQDWSAWPGAAGFQI